MEVVGGDIYIYIYIYIYLSLQLIVTTRMTSALRWTAMRAIIMIDNCEGQSHKTVSTDSNI